MLLRFSRSALLLAAVVIGVPAHAFEDERSFSDIARTRNVVSDYADCIVVRYTHQSVDAVVNDLPNNVIMDRYRRLNSMDCMGRVNDRDGSGVRFPGDTFRYMLGEGLVRLHYRESGPTDFAAVPPLARERVPPLDEAWLATLRERRQREERESHMRRMGLRAVAILGECVARREPDASRRLAFTEPASAAEGAALDALRLTLGACLPAEQTVRLNRETVRGVILVSYYRLAHAAQPPVIATADR